MDEDALAEVISQLIQDRDDARRGKIDPRDKGLHRIEAEY